jgi:mannose-6-phosphate isomerase-like protein (cupin superfamily)
VTGPITPVPSIPFEIAKLNAMTTLSHSYRGLPRVEKLWGGEYWLVNTPDYCSKVLELFSGAQGSLHYHLDKDETFFVVEGLVRLEVQPSPASDEPRTVLELSPGDFYHLPPGTPHRFSSLTPRSLILEASTHHEDADTHRLEDSRILPCEVCGRATSQAISACDAWACPRNRR